MCALGSTGGKLGAMDTYSAPELSRALGISYTNVDYWARVGLAKPTVGAKGVGSVRAYTFEDAVVLAACAATSYLGNGHRHTLARMIRENFKAASVRLEVSPVLCLIVNLAQIRRETRAGLDFVVGEKLRTRALGHAAGRA
jgi:hypothetical protein